MLENPRGLTLVSSAALVWLCSVGPLAAVLIPLLLPVLQQSLHLSPGELGFLASADLAGACIAAVSAPWWLARISSRQGAMAGLAIIVAANGAGAFAEAVPALLLSRLVAGLGTGLLLSGALPLVASSARPARLVSAVQVMQLVVAGGALMAAGPLLSAGNTRELLLAVVAATVVSAPLALLLPAGRSSGTAHQMPTLADMRPAASVLIAIFLYFASVAILGTYAGKLGTQNGLTIGFLSTALAIGNLGGLPGSLIAMLANGARRQRLLLAGATLVQCAGVAAMLLMHGGMAFAAAFFVMQVCMAIIAPLQVAILIDQDASGRAIQALSAAQIVGQAVGPLSVAFAITETSVDQAYCWAVLYVVLSAVLIIRPAQRRAAKPAHP